MKNRMDSKYYSVKSLDLARAVKFITQQDYMIFDNDKIEGQKVYSFLNTEKLQKAISAVLELRNSN